MNYIINSLLDNDLYKFSMMEYAYNNYPDLIVKYKFYFRNQKKLNAKFTKEMVEDIYKEIEHLFELRFNDDELSYLKSLPFFTPGFICFLKDFHLLGNHVLIKNNNGILDLTIEGKWVDTILWEIYLLSIINEVYFRHYAKNIDLDFERARLITRENINMIKDNDLIVSEFGTRRRYSFKWQQEVIETMNTFGSLSGTSNVYFAMKYNMNPIGTQAHEFYEAFQGITHPRASQKMALEEWRKEYKGLLGIALTDTINTDAFLNDFNKDLAVFYSGVRHDSGDPIEWGNKFLNHYKGFGINPMEKTFVFSDGLTIEKAVEIQKHFRGKIGKIIFGIGTFLTNNVGITPLNIVIKMVESNGLQVAKISNEPRKAICEDPVYLNYLKYIFNVK